MKSLLVPGRVADDIGILIGLLVDRDYQEIGRRGWLGRLTVAEIGDALEGYPYALIAPPGDPMHEADVVAYDDRSGWAVDLPLWTAEEGRSDLTLSLDVRGGDDGAQLGISNLHVL